MPANSPPKQPRSEWKRAGLPLLVLLLLLVFSVWNTDAGESTRLRLDAPSRVAIGDPIPVRVTTGLPLSAVEVSWLGERVRLPLRGDGGSRSGEIILGTEVGEDAPGTHWIGIRALDGSSLVHRRKVRIRAKDFPTQHLSLPEDSVTLSPPQLERYKTDKRAIRAALSSRTGKRLWNRPLLWPAHGKITSAYGLGRILNGKKRSPHTGVDLALASGTPVRSTDAGRVALTGKFLFEGKAVFIDHGRGLVSMYFHLASVAVQEGQIVERGEVIGHSGQSGRGTGAHLHFGLSALDRLINPLPLLRKQSAACSDNFIQ